MIHYTYVFAVWLIAAAACSAQAQVTAQEPDMPAPPMVEVKQTDDGWQLLRGGTPIYIQGVGGGNEHMDKLAEIGGNAIRTWSVGPESMQLLDDAQAHDIGIILAVWLPHARGADAKDTYTDPALRARLRADVKAAVEKHRAHPALLVWSLGNESESENNDYDAYWDCLEELAALVQELDPNHPVMTTTSELGREGQPYGQRLRENCPSIDIWGINSYGGMFSIKQRLDEQRATGWAGPHLIMEFGPLGHWEVGKGFDVAPLEQPSMEKALQMAALWTEQIVADPNCLGGCAFLWGQKQEETNTWYGLFVEGRPTAALDVLERQWTGRWPDDLAPVLLSLDADFAAPIAPGSEQSAGVIAFDPEGQPLKFQWSLELRQTNPNSYGQPEDRPQDFSNLLKPAGNRVTFTAPKAAGIYRLFITVEDQAGKVATANVPFKVE